MGFGETLVLASSSPTCPAAGVAASFARSPWLVRAAHHAPGHVRKRLHVALLAWIRGVLGEREPSCAPAFARLCTSGGRPRIIYADLELAFAGASNIITLREIDGHGLEEPAHEVIESELGDIRNMEWSHNLSVRPRIIDSCI